MHLIIQGRDIATADLKQLAKLSGAGGIEQIEPNAFRLTRASPAAGIAALCDEAQLDHAFVPEDRRLADIRLLVMDMDSTLITIETIDELADMIGLKAEVAAITEQAMRGEIEYHESLRRRLELLEGENESALTRVYEERLQLSPGAERLLAQSKRRGIKTLLVSGGFTFVTDRLKPRLALDYTYSNTLEIREGRLTGKILGRVVDAEAKRDELLRVSAMLGIARDQIVGVGDGANDLRFLAECGVSVAYRAKPIVRGHTTHALNHSGLDGMLHLFS